MPVTFLTVRSDDVLLSEKRAIAECSGVNFICGTCKNFMEGTFNGNGRCSLDPFTVLGHRALACDSWEIKDEA